MQIIPYNSEAIQPAQITLVQATYNGNDAGGPAATGLPADTWTVLGQPMVLASTFPSREGYRFVAWNTAANGQGTSYPGQPSPMYSLISRCMPSGRAQALSSTPLSTTTTPSTPLHTTCRRPRR